MVKWKLVYTTGGFYSIVYDEKFNKLDTTIEKQHTSDKQHKFYGPTDVIS